MLVNIHDAKTHLSRLLDRVRGGEEIIIGKAGKPIARLIPYEENAPRSPGAWKGKVVIREDFDDLPSRLSRAFRGDDE